MKSPEDRLCTPVRVIVISGPLAGLVSTRTTVSAPTTDQVSELATVLGVCRMTAPTPIPAAQAVIARATGQRVGACVVLVPPDKRVIAGAAGEAVIALFAVDQVIPGAASHRVVAVAEVGCLSGVGVPV